MSIFTRRQKEKAMNGLAGIILGRHPKKGIMSLYVKPRREAAWYEDGESLIQEVEPMLPSADNVVVDAEAKGETINGCQID